MSIARAFTTRRVKQSLQAADAEHAPQRSSSKKGSFGSLRHKISSPVELIHTTNMLSYSAPSIQPMTATSTGSSHRSDDDMSDSALTNGTTPPTSPDIESSPKAASSRQPNHLSSFFTVPDQAAGSAVQPEAPVVPQRAPSHARRPMPVVGRQRSGSAASEMSQRTLSTKASYNFSRASSSSTSTSATSQSSIPPHHRAKVSGAAAPAPAMSPPRSQRKDYYSESQHPFGNELAQVSEIAEEYGVKEQVVNVASAEEQEMRAKGLLKLPADEYLSEVRELFAAFFGPPRPVAAAWI